MARDPEDELDYEPPPVVPPPPPPTQAPPGPTAPEEPPSPDGGRRRGGGGQPDLGPLYNFPGLPGFVAPTFMAPTLESAMAEPGYAMRLAAGQQALERSAAARGLLRTGGTLRDLTEYGQRFGQQEYSNVYNRALQQYDRTYQGAKDAYAPMLARWNKMADAEIQRALAVYGRRGGGGGGGGSSLPPLDVILGPPPVPPNYAQIQSPEAMAAPAGVFNGGAAEEPDEPYLY